MTNSPEEVRRFIPNYHYLLYDLSTFSDEEIKGEARLRILLSVFRDNFKNNNDELLKVVYHATLALDELEDQETGIEYFSRRQRANHKLACRWRLPVNQREMSKAIFS